MPHAYHGNAATRMTPRGVIVARVALGVTAGAIACLPLVLLPVFLVPAFWPIACVVLLIAVPVAIALVTVYYRFLRKHATGSMWIECLCWISGILIGLLSLVAVALLARDG